jgi:thiamine-phosphate pyrophosphorylase
MQTRRHDESRFTIHDSQFTIHNSRFTIDMRPVICMISDRRRLAGDQDAALIQRVAAAARAGVHLIQIRERDLDARPLTALVERCVAAVDGTRARVVVNDRLDVALAAGAHGVHLRGDSLPAARARSMAPPGFLIGRSVHSLDEAVRAQEGEGLDYLLFGTVFNTASKPNAAPAGLSGLAEVAAATRLPILAVGGMSVSTVRSLRSTGAAGFAAIGLFADGSPDQIGVSVHQASLAFDTPESVP